MKQFKILDKTLDGLPPAGMRRGKANRRYPWPTMEVGQSIFVPFAGEEDTAGKLTKRLRNSISWAKRQGLIDAERDFDFALYPPDEPQGVLAGRTV